MQIPIIAPLIWHFCSSKSLNKIENIQKRALRYLHNDCISDYDIFLKKSKQYTVGVKRLRILALETFKIINEQSFSFMKELFNTRKGSVNITMIELFVPEKPWPMEIKV